MTSQISPPLDSSPRRVENEASKNLLGEADMGKPGDVETRLENQIKDAVHSARWFAAFLVAWLGAGTYFLISAMGDIRAIRQNLKDRGSEIVNNIEHPKTTEDLAANLTLASAQIQVARAEHRKPDSSKLASLQHAIADAASEHTDLPAAWSAAAELISYRSSALHEFPQRLPPCDLVDLKPESRTWRLSNGVVMGTAGYYLSDCSLRLEDVPPLAVTDAGPLHVKPPDSILLVVSLTNGEVIYDGGPIRHEGGFVFENCTFDLRTDGVPTGAARQILTAALTSKDLIQVSTLG